MTTMPQAKFSLSKTHVEFINRHQAFGFQDKSALVREALDQMKARLAQERLVESARLYAEVYAEEEELHDLTEAALEDWPQ
jgi:Arc/MetJ-type ribon-helix-helix transcriptional regulator